MKKIIFSALLMFFFAQAFAAQDEILKTTHFIIHYDDSQQDFARKVGSACEQLYESIAGRLGFSRFNFWLWDERARVHIYAGPKEYMAATGQPEWSAGMTIPTRKAVHFYPRQDNFFDIILPHELGHIIFREFVGFDNNSIPVWLDEGVACYLQSSSQGFDGYLAASLESGSYISLDKMMILNPQFLSSADTVRLFYAEAASLVDFFIKKFGRDKFVDFCRGLRDKRDFFLAVSPVYGFRDAAALEQAWLNYIKNGR